MKLNNNLTAHTAPQKNIYCEVSRESHFEWWLMFFNKVYNLSIKLINFALDSLLLNIIFTFIRDKKIFISVK